MHRFPNISVPSECRRCPTAIAVAAAGRTAFKGLRARYDERPPHAEAHDRTLWVSEASDARLRTQDPWYRELMRDYETARAQRGDMTQQCPGGTIGQSEAGPSHTCNYQPSEGIPTLPEPPGVVLL